MRGFESFLPSPVARERQNQPSVGSVIRDNKLSKKFSMWYFYVLQSQIKMTWFYKWSTNDLPRRLQQHNNKEVESSQPYVPFKLVYYEAYLTEKAARKREMSVKKSGSIWIPLRRRIIESLND